MLLTFSFGQSRFFTGLNLLNIAIQVSLIGLITLGMTLPVITGGLDLSVGSTAALTGVVFVRLLDFGLWPAGCIALITGVVVGLCNGLLIGRLGFSSIIVTLGSMAWADGLALWISHSYPLAGPSGDFEMLGGGFFLHIPLPIVFFVLAAIATYFILNETQFGRDLYATGGNRDLALLCGIPIPSRLQSAYLLSSALAGLSGMILASRLNTASPLVGQDAPLEALVAIVIGGTPLSGGAGGVLNTVLGLCVVEVLTNGLNLWNVAPASRWGITGLVLIVFAVLDRGRRRSRFAQEAS
jgi:ribose transport system permease protein